MQILIWWNVCQWQIPVLQQLWHTLCPCLPWSTQCCGGWWMKWRDILIDSNRFKWQWPVECETEVSSFFFFLMKCDETWVCTVAYLMKDDIFFPNTVAPVCPQCRCHKWCFTTTCDAVWSFHRRNLVFEQCKILCVGPSKGKFKNMSVFMPLNQALLWSGSIGKIGTWMLNFSSEMVWVFVGRKRVHTRGVVAGTGVYTFHFISEGCGERKVLLKPKGLVLNHNWKVEAKNASGIFTYEGNVVCWEGSLMVRKVQYCSCSAGWGKGFSSTEAFKNILFHLSRSICVHRYRKKERRFLLVHSQAITRQSLSITRHQPGKSNCSVSSASFVSGVGKSHCGFSRWDFHSCLVLQNGDAVWGK